MSVVIKKAENYSLITSHSEQGKKQLSLLPIWLLIDGTKFRDKVWGAARANAS
jgi:hypothetical protein